MHGHSLFRSFRSHKGTKGDEQREHAFRIRERKPSEASTASYSSTESRRPSACPTEKSTDWDPLRSHPPMDRARSPSVYLTRVSEKDGFDEESFHHYDRSELEAPLSISSSRSTTDIYGGFDFEFPNGLAPMPARHRRETDGVLTDRRESDLSSTGTETGPTERSEAVTRRPRPAGRCNADDFMRRGDWKRRGVVFTSSFSLAGEEESFDLL